MTTKQLPRTIVNPTHGYSVTFVVSGSENGNAYTIVEVTLPPGEGTGKHYHLDFTEEFEALEGILGITLGKTIIHLSPGDAPALVPVKAVHRFFNPGNAPVRFRCRITPARRFEKLLRIIYGLGDDGLLKPNGMPKSILHLALIYEIGESYLPGMPLGLQRGVFGIIARIARRRGKDKELEKYYTGIIEAYKAI
ncbi:cupin domain-containing protein [Mucilaginibacter pedocola]|uniref:Cupin type-2 domain-containing protein n=1 Tax=Mucilaginibacter pedocola TaxID=1792845 RepID=A0A1S9PHJ4_9SPHI|nr:cupin domain-containing protein [Mucilaginibacter pedocola]OOQ60421.1 hypothetical protein BC343_25755 [Mucilaginibacter pedocola]